MEGVMSLSWVRQVFDICPFDFRFAGSLFAKNPAFLWLQKALDTFEIRVGWSRIQTGRPSRCESWWPLTKCDDSMWRNPWFLKISWILWFRKSGLKIHTFNFFRNDILFVMNESFEEKKYFNGVCRSAYVGRLPGHRWNLRDKTLKDWKVRFGKCGQQMSLSL